MSLEKISLFNKTEFKRIMDFFQNIPLGIYNEKITKPSLCQNDGMYCEISLLSSYIVINEKGIFIHSITKNNDTIDLAIELLKEIEKSQVIGNEVASFLEEVWSEGGESDDTKISKKE